MWRRVEEESFDFAKSDKSSQTELKEKKKKQVRKSEICVSPRRGHASLSGLRLCYPFSAVARGKPFSVNIIYIAIACTVVLLFECSVCRVS